MAMFTSFDDLWQHLEHLPQADVDAIYATAGKDKGYRLALAGLFVVWFGCIAAYSLALPAFYRTYHPSFLIKSILIVLTLLAIWLSIKLAYSLNQQFYNRAVMRQLAKRQGTSDGA